MALPDKNNWKSAHYSIKPYHIFLYEGATKIVLSDYWHPFKENISTHSYFYLDLNEGGNLAASKIRNLECPNYEICLIDYGCGKFNRKIHIMEQYP